jgi:hypothetical protein
LQPAGEKVLELAQVVGVEAGDELGDGGLGLAVRLARAAQP